MRYDLRKTVRRITPAIFALSAYMMLSPTPAEACHKYVSPYTGKTGCGAQRADKKRAAKNTSTAKNGEKNKTGSAKNTEKSGDGTFVKTTSASVGGRLPWPSGMACPYREDPDEFARWRGSRVDALGGWASRTTWNDMRRYFGPHLRRDFISKAPIMVLGLPLLTNESKGDFAGCARGKYDVHFRDVAKKLKRYTSTKKVIRLGWEANGNWYPWAINGKYEAYKSCFRRVSKLLKSVDPSIKISWPVARSVKSKKYTSLFKKAYPGNAYVDYIGLSFYDHWPAAKSQAVWNKSFKPELDFVVSFARKNGKKMAIGEWGLSKWKGGGGGDNPLYIQNMYKFFKENASMIAYELYYNCGPSNSAWRIYPSKSNPRGSAEYRRLW